MDDFQFFQQPHKFLSTQLSQRSQRPPLFQQDIQPWNHSPSSKPILSSKKEERNTITALPKQRKQSVEERIEEMYRKHSRNGVRDVQKGKPNNSRQIYREKLTQLEQGHQFKQLGSHREELKEIPEHDLELLRIKNYSKYHYLDHDLVTNIRDQTVTPDYKCTKNFQRMLKIKDKIRKKNIQTISRDKYLAQPVNLNISSNRRQPSSSELTAKATLERNKLKIKMRGISRQKMKSLEDIESKMEVVGVCSNACQLYGEKEDFRRTWGVWRRTHLV